MHAVLKAGNDDVGDLVQNDGGEEGKTAARTHSEKMAGKEGEYKPRELSTKGHLVLRA